MIQGIVFYVKIFVDGNVASGNGKPDSPFNTIGEAVDLVWAGSTISMKSNIYPEVMTINKKVKLISTEGFSVIGN